MNRDFQIACLISHLDTVADHALKLKLHGMLFRLIGHVARALSEHLKAEYPACK